MPRFLAAFAAIAAATLTSPLAQDLPSPALDGSGQSTQTLELVQEAVSVTIDAGGTISTRSGEADGHLSVDVNGLGVGIGTSQGSVSIPADGQIAGGARPVAAAGGAATAKVATGSAAAASPADPVRCGAEDIGVPLSGPGIAGVGAGSRVILIANCSGLAMTAEQRQALADNEGLMTLIGKNGLHPEDISAITISEDVIVIRYSSGD